MRKFHLTAHASVVADYLCLFVNRRAYTLQSNRPHPASGRHYYYRPKDKKTGQGLSLTLDTIRRHLEGEITIGLYSVNPATQCSKWVAIDADYKDSLPNLLELSSDLSPRIGKGGVLTPPLPTHLIVPPSRAPRLRDCAGRETNSTLEGALRRGQNPALPVAPLKTAESGEKSGLASTSGRMGWSQHLRKAISSITSTPSSAQWNTTM